MSDLLVLSCSCSNQNKSLITILIKALIVLQTESMLMTVPESVFCGVSIRIEHLFLLQNSVHHRSNQLSINPPLHFMYLIYLTSNTYICL